MMDERIIIKGYVLNDFECTVNSLDDSVNSLTFYQKDIFAEHSILLRREPRKDSKNGYWYAYKKIEGVLNKEYIGAKLTFKKVMMVWSKLCQ